MKILSWNVNGLRAVIKKNFLEFIKDEDPDVLCLQETKLQVEQVPQEIHDLTQYHQFWNCAERKGYSGVAVFTKEKPISVEYSIGDEDFDHEGRLLLLEFKEFSLINCYFPNGQKDEVRLQYKMDYYDRMLELMQKVRASGKNLLVCGDVNTAHKAIDLANPKSNEKTSGFLPIERAWIDKIIDDGWVDTFREFNQEPDQYSWWSYRFTARSRNVGWRIDYFFVNSEFLPKIKNAFIKQEIMGSDHCPLGVEI